MYQRAAAYSCSQRSPAVRLLASSFGCVTLRGSLACARPVSMASQPVRVRAFASDNYAPVHPEIMDAIVAANDGTHAGASVALLRGAASLRVLRCVMRFLFHLHRDWCRLSDAGCVRSSWHHCR